MANALVPASSVSASAAVQKCFEDIRFLLVSVETQSRDAPRAPPSVLGNVNSPTLFQAKRRAAAPRL
jgi:hypothetical protein